MVLSGKKLANMREESKKVSQGVSGFGEDTVPSPLKSACVFHGFVFVCVLKYTPVIFIAASS